MKESQVSLAVTKERLEAGNVGPFVAVEDVEKRDRAPPPSSLGRGALSYVLRWRCGLHRGSLGLRRLIAGPPYPPDRTHLRPGKKAVAGPEMLPTSESPVLAEAGARAARNLIFPKFYHLINTTYMAVFFLP